MNAMYSNLGAIWRTCADTLKCLSNWIVFLIDAISTVNEPAGVVKLIFPFTADESAIVSLWLVYGVTSRTQVPPVKLTSMTWSSPTV